MRSWLIAVPFCALAAAPSRAVVYQVNSTNDAPDAVIDGVCATAQGECTLRAAVMEANFGPRPGKSEVVIRVPAGNYVLTVPSTDATDDAPLVDSLDLLRDVHIVGAGATLTRIHPFGHPAFYVGAGVSVKLIGLAVSGGFVVNLESPMARGGAVLSDGLLSISSCSFVDNSAGFWCGTPPGGGSFSCNVGLGAAIYSSGSLEIEASIFEGNHTAEPGEDPTVGQPGSGGAVFSTGPLVIGHSLFERNSAGGCGGDVCAMAATTIENTTLNHSSASFTATSYGLKVIAQDGTEAPSLSMTNVTVYGSGIILVGVDAHLNNVTIARNGGDGIAAVASSLTLRNSIVAANRLWDLACYGSTCVSSGYNIIQKPFLTPVTGPFLAADPLLGPLQHNGGPPLALTAFPGPGSPAINAGDPAGCRDGLGNLLATDQRGVKRPIGPRCDLGAVEANPSGDVDGDGIVSAADVFYLIDYLFAGGPAPLGTADANGDGTIDSADVFFLIDYLFAGGPAPA